MPYMSQSPSTTELDDIVRISPPAKYVALASTDSETKVKLEPVDGLRDPLDQKPELTFDVGKQVKQQVEAVDMQKMVEQTVKRVREQSDRWVCPLPPAVCGFNCPLRYYLSQLLLARSFSASLTSMRDSPV